MFVSGVSKGELVYLNLAINESGLVGPTGPGSVWKKFAAEYLCETNISIFISHLLFFVL